MFWDRSRTLQLAKVANSLWCITANPLPSRLLPAGPFEAPELSAHLWSNSEFMGLSLRIRRLNNYGQGSSKEEWNSEISSLKHAFWTQGTERCRPRKPAHLMLLSSSGGSLRGQPPQTSASFPVTPSASEEVLEEGSSFRFGNSLGFKLA